MNYVFLPNNWFSQGVTNRRLFHWWPLHLNKILYENVLQKSSANWIHWRGFSASLLPHQPVHWNILNCGRSTNVLCSSKFNVHPYIFTIYVCCFWCRARHGKICKKKHAFLSQPADECQSWVHWHHKPAKAHNDAVQFAYGVLKPETHKIG